jgi:hypothetical protein
VREAAEYPNIVHMLNAVFNINASLSDEASKSLYVRSAIASGKVLALKRELAAAFTDASICWQQLLFNDEYEVFAADTEEEARAYAYRILVEPLEHA